MCDDELTKVKLLVALEVSVLSTVEAAEVELWKWREEGGEEGGEGGSGTEWEVLEDVGVMV